MFMTSLAEGSSGKTAPSQRTLKAFGQENVLLIVFPQPCALSAPDPFLGVEQINN